MEENNNNFLQSDIWRKFQEAVGCQTFFIESGSAHNTTHNEAGRGFSASIIEHKLPIVGKYFYVPRGPVCHLERSAAKLKDLIKNKLDPSTEFIPVQRVLGMTNIIYLAKKNNAGWIRIEPENEETLDLIKKNTNYKIAKAPHDMQPREILVMDITKLEEELLTGMKSKTRYNIKLAEKKGVSINVIPTKAGIQGHDFLDSGSGAGMTARYINEFIRLIKLTEKRKGIKFHSADYYQKMLEVIPGDILKLYVAEYKGKIIAANLVIFFGDTATYLHGATDDEYRNVMAPYLLQWQAIKDAKKAGFLRYDFGGVKRISPLSLTPSPAGRGWLEKPSEGNSWSGITKFKLGFAPNTEPVIFPGSYDLVINTPKYFVYWIFSQLKSIL